MDKLKNLLIMVISLALVVLLAWLPNIVAWTTDVFAHSEAGTIPVQAIQTTQPEQEDTASVIRLLQMERNMYSVPISADQTSMTQDDVMEIVNQWMEDCQEAGFFQVFYPSYEDIQPFLCMDNQGNGTFGVIWGVELAAEEEPYHDFFLHLDDSTGRILYVNYQTANNTTEIPTEPYDSLGITSDRYIDSLESFADVYFRQLGYFEAAEYARSTDTGYSCEILSDDTVCATYSFGDSQYGEISIAFYVYGNGNFHNYFP